MAEVHCFVSHMYV